MTRSLLARLAFLASAFGACSLGPNPFLPATDAPPLEVLTAYLAAYKDGQCSWARQLWIDPVPNTGDGDLCGDARLLAYSISPEPARPTADIADFATSLTTNGSRDGSVEAGEITWFFELDRQADGSWRIRGGGSGP